VATATGNTIRANFLRFNARLTTTAFDALDLSHGAGTAGTGNTWAANSIGTASPAGLKS